MTSNLPIHAKIINNITTIEYNRANPIGSIQFRDKPRISALTFGLDISPQLSELLTLVFAHDDSFFNYQFFVNKKEVAMSLGQSFFNPQSRTIETFGFAYVIPSVYIKGFDYQHASLIEDCYFLVVSNNPSIVTIRDKVISVRKLGRYQS